MTVADIGMRIRLRRQELGLRQAELARKIGVHVATVGSWERGTHYPGRHLGALEATLGITLSEPPREPVFADPDEAAIWAMTRLPADMRRHFIGELRRLRAAPAVPAEWEEPPGTAAGA